MLPNAKEKQIAILRPRHYKGSISKKILNEKGKSDKVDQYSLIKLRVSTKYKSSIRGFYGTKKRISLIRRNAYFPRLWTTVRGLCSTPFIYFIEFSVKFLFALEICLYTISQIFGSKWFRFRKQGSVYSKIKFTKFNKCDKEG